MNNQSTIELVDPALETTTALPIIPEERESRFFAADTSGVACLNHDSFDLDSFDQALSDYPNFKHTIDQSGSTLSTGSALMRDLFWSFHKRAPMIAPPAPLKHAYEINKQILEQVMNTIEWKQVREAGTADDLMMSSIATMSVAENAITALDQSTIEKINDLNGLESQMAQLFSQAESLDELAEKAKGRKANDLFERAQQARLQAEETQTQLEELNEEVNHEIEQAEAAIRQAARQGLSQAEQEIDSTNEAIKAYSGGYDQGGFGLAKNGHSTKEKLDLAQKVRASDKLKQIAELCGRLTRIALAVQKAKVKHPPDEIASIEIGNNVARMLPSELCLLADPELEDLFVLKFIEKRLTQYELIHHEPQGRGPIILAIDESASMNEPAAPQETTTKEVWSKGIALALMAIARLQKRDIAIIHFASRNQIKTEFFSKGQASPEEALQIAEFFYDGSTAFEPWMEKALELIDQSTFDKADVICVTDGLASISPTVKTNWLQTKAARAMRAFGILIGTDEGASVLASITDAMLPLDMLKNDDPILQTIFGI
jgi:uncharacterized protein with von Willebrand factor type A (vWA) domain